jgi:RNAse (barnase) inhibitor barstar
MGVFKRNGRIDPEGLDWYILQSGWTSLYWRTTILEDDLKWFEKENYVIIEFNCKTWDNDKIMHSQLKEKLDFPDYYGENFNALRDCLTDLNIIKTGLVLVFRHLDNIKKQTAHAILDIMANNARLHMLFGNRIITLAQVDNPDYEIDPVGQTSVIWNGQEWFNSSREIKE